MDTRAEARSLISELRKEAADARACFRTLAIQSMGISIAGIAAVSAILKENDFACVGMVGVLLVTSAAQRTGIHKFSTANRIYGYQLHIERLSGEEVKRMAGLGWEVACRAWRIVQATVFDAVYTTPSREDSLTLLADVRPDFFQLKEKYRSRVERMRSLPAGSCEDAEAAELWWMQETRVRCAGAKYHAGSYLERMFSVLSAVQVFGLVPFAIVVCRRFVGAWEAVAASAKMSGLDRSVQFIQTMGFTGWGALLCAAVGIWWIHVDRKSLVRRREMLENEMLSIHSCSIMWRAVVMAHLCAWQAEDVNRRAYTERLSRAAIWFAAAPDLLREITGLESLPPEFCSRRPEGKDEAERRKDVRTTIDQWRQGEPPEPPGK